VRPPALTGRNLLHFDDLNAMSSGTMTSGHVSIALRYGSTHSDVSIFTIHIVGSTTRVVTQPDCDVLDLRRPAFEDLFTAYDFSSCLFDLLEFSYEKPKPALGYYIVRCEYPHLHQWRGLDFLCWPSATDNLELLQLSNERQKITLYIGDPGVQTSTTAQQPCPFETQAYNKDESYNDVPGRVLSYPRGAISACVLSASASRPVYT
jgi:hypothetical protein